METAILDLEQDGESFLVDKKLHSILASDCGGDPVHGYYPSGAVVRLASAVTGPIWPPEPVDSRRLTRGPDRR